MPTNVNQGISEPSDNVLFCLPKISVLYPKDTIQCRAMKPPLALKSGTANQTLIENCERCHTISPTVPTTIDASVPLC